MTDAKPDLDLEAIERRARGVTTGDPFGTGPEEALALVAEVRQLRREYRCAECSHNVKRAEKAERERDEARKAYMDLMAERNQIHAERDEARSERDMERLAREQNADRATSILANSQHNTRLYAASQVEMEARAEKAERERDEALAGLTSAVADTLDGTRTKWLPDDCSRTPLTDEDFYAIRRRWATGPEQYQADADALISSLIFARRERDEARAAAQVCEHHRAAGVEPEQVCVPCLQAQLQRLEVERGGRTS